jgi:hypothetical protein
LSATSFCDAGDDIGIIAEHKLPLRFSQTLSACGRPRIKQSAAEQPTKNRRQANDAEKGFSDRHTDRIDTLTSRLNQYAF